MTMSSPTASTSAGAEAILKSKDYHKLTSDILEFFEENKQKENDFQRKKDFKQRIQSVINKHGSMSVNLRFYGSTLNGFGTRSSDIDMTLDVNMRNNWLDGDDALRSIHRVLGRHCDFITDLELVLDATVPLVRGTDDITDYQWQITASNNNAVRATNLLRAYSKIDPRVAPLAIVIKKWATCHYINNARESAPNNYCWTLLLIYYLQDECFPPVVPSLMEENPTLLNDNVYDRTPTNRCNNTQSLGELLAGFFKFYSTNISCHKVFSIKEGCLLEKYRVRSRSPRGQWNCLLCVEDPCTGNNVARSVFKYDKFHRIPTRLKHACDLTTNKHVSLQSLFQNAI